MSSPRFRGINPVVRLRLRYGSKDSYTFDGLETEIENTRRLLTVSAVGLSKRGSVEGWYPRRNDFFGGPLLTVRNDIRIVGLNYNSPLEVIIEVIQSPVKWPVLAWASLQATHRLVRQVSHLRVTLAQDSYEAAKLRLLKNQISGEVGTQMPEDDAVDEKSLVEAASEVLDDIEESELEPEKLPDSDDPLDFSYLKQITKQ